MPSTLQSETLTAFWQEQIDAWKASGQSQKAFCKAHDLNYPRFGYWLRKFRQQDTQHDQPPRFIPVTPAVAHSNSSLSLVLPSGLELRGIASDNLSIVEQLLKRLS